MARRRSISSKSQEFFIGEFAAHLRHAGFRFTEERRQILEVIFSAQGHFSADQVLEKMKAQRRNASRATLYRLLGVLEKTRFIQQSLLSEGQTHYEVIWNRDHHDHLICTNCNQVIEFQDDTIEILQREIANKYGFVLDDHVMELFGRCSGCRATRSKSDSVLEKSLNPSL